MEIKRGRVGVSSVGLSTMKLSHPWYGTHVNSPLPPPSSALNDACHHHRIMSVSPSIEPTLPSILPPPEQTSRPTVRPRHHPCIIHLRIYNVVYDLRTADAKGRKKEEIPRLPNPVRSGHL